MRLSSLFEIFKEHACNTAWRPHPDLGRSSRKLTHLAPLNLQGSIFLWDPVTSHRGLGFLMAFFVFFDRKDYVEVSNRDIHCMTFFRPRLPVIGTPFSTV